MEGFLAGSGGFCAAFASVPARMSADFARSPFDGGVRGALWAKTGFLPQDLTRFRAQKADSEGASIHVTMVRKPCHIWVTGRQRASRAASALGLTLPVVVRSGHTGVGHAQQQAHPLPRRVLLAGATYALSACTLVRGVTTAGATNMGGAPGTANDLATGGQGGRTGDQGGGGSGSGSGRN
jgi:hypothetical protein